MQIVCLLPSVPATKQIPKLGKIQQKNNNNNNKQTTYNVELLSITALTEHFAEGTEEEKFVFGRILFHSKVLRLTAHMSARCSESDTF